MKKIDLNTIHPQELIAFILDKIYKSGNTTTSGGNISIRDENGDIWVTPSGIDKGTLTSRDINCVRKDGTIEGLHKPSSEYPFHIGIFNKRDDINAVIHAHSPALVAFSIVAKQPNTKITPWAYSICEEMGLAAYRVPGSQELGDVIAEEFAKGYNGVIMENHGVVIGGKDMMEAYNRFETLELLAQTLVNAAEFGTPIELSKTQLKDYVSKSKNNLDTNNYIEITSDEKAIRKEIIAFMDRSCYQKLMYTSIGVISVRLQGNDFITTPKHEARWNLCAEDLIQVKSGKLEVGKIANDHLALHKKIFEQNADVKAIVQSSPPNLMSFSVIHKKLDVRTIPESWIFLQDVMNVKYGKQFEETNDIADNITLQSPLAVIDNDSIVSVGANLTLAFDRLEIGEFSAKSLVMGNKLGEFKPMSEKDVEDLRIAFLQ